MVSSPERVITRIEGSGVHDCLIILRLEEGELKVGGIIVTDSAKEKPQNGR
jgi:co-chaperonin GroES (HSP10)